MPNSLQAVNTNHIFLEEIFEHILLISRGDCLITDDLVESTTDDSQRNILSGLQLLYEDLELYKQELRNSIEAEYQLNILKERNKELAQFNFVASHDLQEPLGTIQNFVGLIEKRNAPNLDDAGKTHFGFIKSAATRMSDLITGLLQYSIIGKDYNLELVNTQQIVEEISSNSTANIQTKNLQIQIEGLPKITAHKEGIQQVFQHLIGNALKFHTEEKRIILEVSCSSDQEGYTFCIKDNGIGIEEEFHDKIFRLFYQLNNKNQYKGTGIGLAQCEKIIKMHNGRIWVKSIPSCSASFFFFIPKLAASVV